MTFEAVAEVVLSISSANVPASSPESFGFIVNVGAEAFSSAVVPHGSSHLDPGISSQVRLRFLVPEAAATVIRAGSEFTFFEQRRTGKGRVISVHYA